MKKIISVLISVLFASCLFAASIQVVDANKFETMINSEKNLYLFDVRTPEEFSQGHIKNSINNDIYSNKFKNIFAKIDKNETIYIYCRSGKRSAMAASELEKLGFKNIYDLKDGILSWQLDKKPLEK